jgi:phosphopentomutase
MDKYLPEFDVIVTADHGGHDRMHGTTDDTDMIIPIFFAGEEFEKGLELEGVSILDIAPTIAKLLSVEPDEDWEGKSLI